MMPLESHLEDRKRAVRAEAQRLRRRQADKDALSTQILARLLAMEAYQQARAVLYYVDVRDEVRTRAAIATALADASHRQRTIAVPYCVDGQLELFHLESMDELQIGSYEILEPSRRLRSLPSKQIDVRSLDLVVVPGVAFDRNARRLGHGKGYYDRLLQRAGPDTVLVALAFECQLFDEIPCAEHDVSMDFVLTPDCVYKGTPRR